MREGVQPSNGMKSWDFNSRIFSIPELGAADAVAAGAVVVSVAVVELSLSTVIAMFSTVNVARLSTVWRVSGALSLT